MFHGRHYNVRKLCSHFIKPDDGTRLNIFHEWRRERKLFYSIVMLSDCSTALQTQGLIYATGPSHE